MSDDLEGPKAAYALADRMLSPPLVLAASAALFLLCAVALEWQTILNALARLLDRAW